MKNYGFISNSPDSPDNHNTIHLIKINNNKPNEEPIFRYNFQSITDIGLKKLKKKPNKSTYRTEILCTKEKKLNN